jgi:hypothetical protein
MSPSLHVVLVWVTTDCQGADGPGILYGISTFAHGSDHLSNTSTARTSSSTRDELRRQQETVQGPSEMITIFIKCLTGRTDMLSIRESDPISQVFERYARSSGIPVDQIRLFTDRQLERNGGVTVHETGIRDGSTIHLVLRLSTRCDR